MARTATRKPKAPDPPAQPDPPRPQGELADLREQVAELRAVLVQLMRHQGVGRPGAQPDHRIAHTEVGIPLEGAVELIWGRRLG